MVQLLGPPHCACAKSRAIDILIALMVKVVVVPLLKRTRAVNVLGGLITPG
jgi:hypothetical protein